MTRFSLEIEVVWLLLFVGTGVYFGFMLGATISIGHQVDDVARSELVHELELEQANYFGCYSGCREYQKQYVDTTEITSPTEQCREICEGLEQ